MLELNHATKDILYSVGIGGGALLGSFSWAKGTWQSSWLILSVVVWFFLSALPWLPFSLPSIVTSYLGPTHSLALLFCAVGAVVGLWKAITAHNYARAFCIAVLLSYPLSPFLF